MVPSTGLYLPASFYLIDASIYIFRAYFSLPENWRSEDGYPTHAVYGYLNFLLNLLEQESPEFIAAAFDESLGTCYRNDIYPDYKSNRVLPDEALAFQLNACVEVTKLLGITGLASDTHEADDIVGTLAKVGRNQGHKIVVVSGDKDLAQLVSGQDVIWDFGKKDPQNREAVKERLGVWPEQVADYLALVGDSIDCIPGVPGVGAKTAMALLDHFPDIDALMTADPTEIVDLPVRGAKKLPAKIEEYREQILMARKLTLIADDAPVAATIGSPQLQRQSIALGKLAEFCERMGLAGRLIARAEKVEKALIERTFDKKYGTKSTE